MLPGTEGVVLVGRPVLVRAGDTEFFVEVVERPGVATVGLDDVVSFQGVREAISAIAGEVAAAWGKVRPSEAKIEFGLNLTAKTGKLAGLLVEGGAEASLKVTVSWTHVPVSQVD